MPVQHGGPEWNHVLPAEAFGDPELDCRWDLDGNGITDFQDLLILLAQWGPCVPGQFCEWDFDFDGVAGFSELLVILAQWGPCP